MSLDRPEAVLMWVGPWEIAIIVLIAIVVFGFGARKLPDIGKGLGEGISNFRKALTGHDDSSDGEEDDSSTKD